MLTRSGVFGILASLNLLASLASAAPASDVVARTKTYVGNINMTEACHWEHDDSWWDAHYGNDANGWRCEDSYGSSVGLILDNYCWRKYDGAYADAPGGGLYDWGCYKNI
jgi:hypothetical protein